MSRLYRFPTMATSGSILGNPVLRIEDPRILRGDADYFDDLAVEGLLHVVFVRSTMAHARIESVDTSEAEAMPGVVAVYTADDLGLEPGPGLRHAPAGAVSRPPLATRRRALRRRHRRGRRRRDARAGRRRGRDGDRRLRPAARRRSIPRPRSPTARRCCSPSTARTSRSSSTSATTRPILDGADVVVERPVRQPAPRRGADGAERHPRRADGDDGLTVHVPTQAPHGVRDPLARRARTRARAGPRDRARGRRRLRRQDRRVPRVRDRRRRRPASSAGR